jgi:hypothetical protein
MARVSGIARVAGIIHVAGVLHVTRTTRCFHVMAVDVFGDVVVEGKAHRHRIIAEQNQVHVDVVMALQEGLDSLHGDDEREPHGKAERVRRNERQGD